MKLTRWGLTKFVPMVVTMVALAVGELALGVVSAPPAGAATDTVTSFSFASPPGDWIGQGQAVAYTPSVAQFAVYGCGGGRSSAGCVTVAITGNDGSWWTVTLQAPAGEQLHQGNYSRATRARVGVTAAPGLDVSGNGRGCNALYGSFTIAHLTADATGAITVLDASFTQACESSTAPALVGQIQYRAPLAARVTESLSNSSIVAGQPLTLAAVVSGQTSGTVSFFDNGNKIGNASVDLNGFAALVTSAVTPGDHAIVAVLKAAGPASDRQSAPVSLTVLPAATSYYFVSGAGDYVGQGATASYSSPSLALPGTLPSFTMSGNPTDLRVSVTDGNDSWTIELAAPPGQVLVPGTYTDAERASFRTTGHPGLDVYGDGRGCNTVSGSFTINSIIADPSGAIGKLDATFVENCEGIMPPISGSLEYHTDLVV